MAQTSGFDPMLKVKTCFDCKMLDVANWVALLNREDDPSVSSHVALEISSVVGQPPSLVRHDYSSPRVMAKPWKPDEGWGPLLQRPQCPNLYRSLKQRLGRSLRASLYKRSVVGEKATYKCSRVEGGISGPEKIQ